MNYAVIKHGSTQYKVSEGDTIKVVGSKKSPKFEVLFLLQDGKLTTDKDALKTLKVEAVTLNMVRERKLRVGRFKSKSRYDKIRGSREHFTNVRIEKIGSGIRSTPTTGKMVVKSDDKPKKKTVTKPVKSAGIKFLKPKKVSEKVK